MGVRSASRSASPAAGHGVATCAADRASQRWLRLAGAMVLAAAAAGCTPEIGDECATALDCSTLGDRLCDRTQPDGYCTIFNCEPDSCPDEAVCVAFKTDLDPACKQVDDGRFGRFGRTFCMRVCDDGDDCRAGYICEHPDRQDAWVVDKETDH